MGVRPCSSSNIADGLDRAASKIVQVFVKEGDAVEEGQPLVAVEAMKTVRSALRLGDSDLRTDAFYYRNTFSGLQRPARSARYRSRRATSFRRARSLLRSRRRRMPRRPSEELCMY